MTPPTQRAPADPADRGIRRSWVLFAGSFTILAVLAFVRLAVADARWTDWLIAGLIVVVGIAAVGNRLAVQALETGRRVEAESFARILQGLSRSVSPDAIMEAIIEEIGAGTGADHIVVVRRRPDARVLEATLVNTRTGGPSSSTLFPISDLEDPPDLPEIDRRGRRPRGADTGPAARIRRERRSERSVQVVGVGP